MRPGRLARLLAVAVTVIAVSSALIAVLLAFVAQQGWSDQDGRAVVWIMPVAVALMVVGVSWLLMGETPRRDFGAPRKGPFLTCPGCQREVAPGWRLCPWCGYRDDGRPVDGADETADACTDAPP